MEKLKLVYQNFNHAYYEIQTEEVTLWNFRIEYEQRISKRIPKSMQDFTLEEWSRFAYNRNLEMLKIDWKDGILVEEYNDYLDKYGFPFEVTALLESTGQLYARLAFMGCFMTLSFIDEHNRSYMSYEFTTSHYGGYKENRDGYIFLRTLSLWFYEKEQRKGGYWEVNAVTHYEFTPEGELEIHEFKEGADGKERETIYKADKPIDVSDNWQKYPEFGDWMPLFEMKRWGGGGFKYLNK